MGITESTVSAFGKSSPVVTRPAYLEASLHGVSTSGSLDSEVVTILLATYNGERFLHEQLSSLANQSWPSIDLVISDDGSDDGTLKLARKFSQHWGKGCVAIAEGPKRGFSENFRSLLLNADVRGKYVAFCDQDDVWRRSKLKNAIAYLSSQPEHVPALYCGRTKIIPGTGKRKMSPLFSKPPCFRNALVQSIAGGNTMVMNRAAFELLRESVRRTSFVSHDWWCYLLITGCGGRVFYSRKPEVHYRQHDLNLVGANNSIFARLARLRYLVSGRFRYWTDENLKSLAECWDLLEPEAWEMVKAFRRNRQANMFKRIYGLRRTGIHRQTKMGQISLFVATVFRLI